MHVYILILILSYTIQYNNNKVSKNKKMSSRNKIKNKPYTRSHTKQQLPSIGVYTPRLSRPNQLSSYLNHVTHELSGNAEYDQMDVYKVNKEQHKLKEILRKINDDTVKIISTYTPRPKKQTHINSRTTTSILAVREKQSENNTRILAQCQVEIQVLRERMELLNSHSKEEYNEKIRDTVAQIAIMQEAVKEIRSQNARRGKNIVIEEKIIQDGEIKKIQNDVFVAEHRAEKLRTENHRVYQQLHFYEEKLRKMEDMYKQAGFYQKQFNKKDQENQKNKSVEKDYFRMKGSVEKIKKKKEFNMQSYQFKYYRILRQLEQAQNINKNAQDKIQQKIVSIQASQISINKLEEQLAKLKRQRKDRDKNINQFLSQTRRMGESRASTRKIGDESPINSKREIEDQFNIGEMPSDIQVKNQPEGDNSALLLLKGESKQSKKNEGNGKNIHQSRQQITTNQIQNANSNQQIEQKQGQFL